MKKFLLFTILAALLTVFVGVSMISADDGKHKGYVLGIGHTDYPGNGLAIGYDKHECDPTCPLCGGNPCIPPCPGAGNNVIPDEPRNDIESNEITSISSYGKKWELGLTNMFRLWLMKLHDDFSAYLR